MTATLDSPVLEVLEPSPTRTYGRYRYMTQEQASGFADAARAATRGGLWVLQAEAAVSMRLKRTFGRVQVNRGGQVMVGHTLEVARDLQWFMERYPLAPHDDASLTKLTASALDHRTRETDITRILAGGHRTQTLDIAPTVAPREYQQIAADLMRRMGGILVTDEVGLGKTLTAALGFLHQDALPAVVVAPSHLAAARKGRWVEELAKHFPHLTYHVVKKGTVYDVTDKKTGREPDVLIITYSKLDGWASHLSGWAKYVVFDEVQDLRGGTDTVKGRAAARLAAAVPYRMGLTATPVYNYAGEVWHIVDILAPGALGSKDEFEREWATESWSNHMKVGDPHALGSYLREQGIMIGRTRKQVGRELPDTVKVTHTVQTNTAALDAVAGDAAALAHLILSSTTDRFDRFRAAGEIDMLMRQATGIAKAPYVAEFVRLLLESEQKIVLFGWHRAVYDLWLERLAEFKPMLYTGSESPNQKGKALEAFMDGDSRILIMSLRSGSGVDGLQEIAKVVVFGELDWSPQVHEQGIGRVRRDGMDGEPAVAYFLVAEEGSDPAIAQVLQVKRQQGEPLVNPEGTLFNNATSDVNRTRLLAEAAIARASALTTKGTR